MKLFATAIVVAATSLLAPAANAASGTIAGYQATVVDSGSYSQPDSITVYGPNGSETITVTCAPFAWRSYGANTKQFADMIAREWCF
jgi:hypothetical protein